MDDTVKLMQECDLGCKIAVMNFNHISEYVKDNKLRQVLDSYRAEHEKLDCEICEALKDDGSEEKEPSVMTRAMSWVNTDLKLLGGETDKQIAKLMMDGSNMGIQNISGSMTKYVGADSQSVGFAKRLITINEHIMRDMKEFL